MKELLEKIRELKYYVGNPSAWEAYDDKMSERIQEIVLLAERFMPPTGDNNSDQ